MDNNPIQDENPYLVSDSVNERWEPIRDSDAKPPNQTMLYIGWFAVWLLNMFFPIGILVSSPASEESSMSSIAIGCGALSVLCLGFEIGRAHV